MRMVLPFDLLRRIPPGAWVALAWAASTASSLRAHVGLPFMPQGLPAPSAGDWVLIGVAAVAALAGCRLLGRQPVVAVALVVAGSFAVALGDDSTAIAQLHFVAIDVAMGAVVANRSRRTGIAAFVLAIAALPGYALTRTALGLPLESDDGIRDSWQGWQLSLAMAVVAWLIGNSVRQTRAYAQRLSAQAAREAVTAERLRIARELHDMVAHTIGIVALQAGAARRVIDTQPAQAREALGEIEIASRETLSGLRRMLGALRRAEPAQVSSAVAPDAAGSAGARSVGAPPVDAGGGLADLDWLAEQTTAAGVRVDVRWHGERPALPPEIDISAYRIIQEAITNTVRHAGTDSCRVSIGCRDGALSIEVVDDGHGRGDTAGAGYGLVGMRERVALLHGELSVGPRPGGGFRVAARLPVPAPIR